MYLVSEYKTPAFSFVGYSGSGKTTIIEKLIPHFVSRGIKIAVVKHDAHKIEMDKPGKDTYKFYEAGADVVAISSTEKLFTVKRLHADEDGEAILSNIQGVDLIIVEGYRNAGLPKIGVCRVATGKGLSVDKNDLIALVGDSDYIEECKNDSLPIFDCNDISSIADFICNTFLESPLPVTNDKEDITNAKTTAIQTFISYEDAKNFINDFPVRKKIEILRPEFANDRILAVDVIAKEQIPPFDRSPLDGYAFRAIDTLSASPENPVCLTITEEIPAGSFPKYRIESGQAAKILTGAPIPNGATAVSRFEDTEYSDTTVTLFTCFKEGQNIVNAGEDIDIGDVIAKEGTRITPPVLGLLASVGIHDIQVFRKPIVSLISTGSELLSVNDELIPGKIRNSSMYMLGGYIEEAGAKVLSQGIAEDDVTIIANTIKDALNHSDMVITTGGVSVGDYDLVIDALKLINAEILFWKINMKPGMAMAMAKSNNKMILCLSGNPGAAAMSLRTLGIPFIKKLCGVNDIWPETITALMHDTYNKKSPSTRFLPGSLVIKNERAYFKHNEDIGNGVISTLVGSDLIAIIEKGSKGVNSGECITAIKL